MSRFLTLEEYLEQFVDDGTQPAGDNVLIVTEQQAQMLGYFFLNGLTGFLECARLERAASCEDERDDQEFVN